MDGNGSGYRRIGIIVCWNRWMGTDVAIEGLGLDVVGLVFGRTVWSIIIVEHYCGRNVIVVGGSSSAGGDGDRFGRKKSVLAIVEHGDSKLLHDGVGLEVEAPEHSIAVPPAKHFDYVEIDFATEQGHGAASAKRAGANFARVDASCVLHCRCSRFEGIGDVSGFDGD